MKFLLSILLILIVPIFGISGDGENEPITKNSVTVKDTFGIETGLTKNELEQFKENYFSQFKQGTRDAVKYWNYCYKVDLNKYDELKKVGIDLKKAGSFAESKTYKENTIYSHIIIIGKTISQRKNDYEMINKLEIDSIIKGKNILFNKFGEIPKSLDYPSQPNVVGETQPVIGIKAVYFLAFPHPESRIGKKYWIMRRPESTILCLNDINVLIKESIYNPDSNDYSKYKSLAEEGVSNKYILDNFNTLISIMKQIIDINDAENFYKKNWLKE